MNASSDKAVVILVLSLKVGMQTKQDNVLPLGANGTCWFDTVGGQNFKQSEVFELTFLPQS